MYNLLLATLTVKVHFMTFRVERILPEITYYFKKIIKNSLQPLYLSQDIRVSVILTTFFAHISGSTGPILLTSKTILSATKFPIMLVNIIFSVSVIFLEIFSKNNDPSFKTE